MTNATKSQGGTAPNSSEDRWEVIRNGEIICTGSGLARLHAEVRAYLSSIAARPLLEGRPPTREDGSAVATHAVYMNRAMQAAGTRYRVYLIEAAYADLAREEALNAGLKDRFVLMLDPARDWRPMTLPREDAVVQSSATGMPHKVVIDGVEYAPSADIPELTDVRLNLALRELVTILYRKDSDKVYDHAWHAVQALAPDLAQLAAEDTRAAYERIWGPESAAH